MKTVFFLVTATILSLPFTSCKKRYTCHCLYKTNGSPAYQEDFRIEAKKKDAVAKCDESDFSKNVTVGDSTYLSTAECDLKNK